MKIYDISATISPQIVTYNNEDKPEIKKIAQIALGQPCNITQINFNVHTATHVDAFSHFSDNQSSIEKIALEHFIGHAQVIYIEAPLITKEHLKAISIQKGDRLLFKTNNSKLNKNVFEKNYTALSLEAANYLVEKKISLVGIDYLSIEAFDSTNYFVHKTLLKNNIVILEGLVLKDVKPGNYELIALPLKISNSDGSPVRAILRTL